MTGLPLTLRRWTRHEYERLVDLGLFQHDPVELIGGLLVVAEPQGSYHATALGAADDVLRAMLPPGWIVRTQMPIALDEESAPEPDLAMVPGTRGDYRESPGPHLPWKWRIRALTSTASPRAVCTLGPESRTTGS
jgi:hypothetical protein